MSDLLADPGLDLRLLSPPGAASDAPITWVATTELPDPLPFLRGGELVLTTGLLPRSDREWGDLVHRLGRLPVAGLCMGTGLVHESVPPALVAAAGRSGLALLSSPVSVPFVQISRWVADRLFAEHYAEVNGVVALHDQLTADLLAGHGLAALLKTLHRHLDAGAVAVIEAGGHVLERYPAASTWPTRQDVLAASSNGSGRDVTVAGTPVAEVRTERVPAHPAALSFATRLLALEVSRQHAVRTGRRELLGQVLQDVLDQAVTEPQAQRRLRACGVDASAAHAVVVVDCPQGGQRLRTLPWTLGRLLGKDGDRWPVALVQDVAVVLLPPEVDPIAGADVVAGHVRPLDAGVRIGVGAHRPRVAGLRLGFHEARQASRHGPGVHRAAPLSLGVLLLGNRDLPLQEAAAAVLAPLVRHDREQGSELVVTLRCYLDCDCRPGETARTLTLHRNSLRHRLQLIESLTDRDLGSLTDRMELWLALATVQTGAGGA